MIPTALHLIDGHSLAFKAYYAIRGLTGPGGVPTGAVFGFLRMLLKFLDEFKPTHLAVVFDTGKPTFRHELYEPYKANREAAPADFEEQMRWIDRLLGAMGLAVFRVEGFEADDVMATLATRVAAAGGEAAILTADKDLLQLVADRVVVLRPGLDEIRRCDADAVADILGVRPGQVADYLALVGDSSDNIPGVPGIGKKTASQLIETYGSLDAILAAADSIAKPKMRESLLANAGRARLAHRLATLRRDVPLDWNLDACALPPDLFNPRVVALVQELGFQSILKERGVRPVAAQADSAAIPAAAPTAPAIEVKYQIIRDEGALDRWLERAMAAEWVALDTETTSTDVMAADLVGISLCDKPGEAIYIPVGHYEHVAGGPQLSVAVVRERLGPLLGGFGPRLAAHHAKYDWKLLKRAGFDPVAPACDTMIASYVLNPDRPGGHGLKALAHGLCSMAMTPISELIGSGRKAITMAEVDADTAGAYAAADADATLRLRGRLAAELDQVAPLKKLFEQIEMPLIEVLIDMELGGFNIDTGTLDALRRDLDRRLNDLGQRIWREAGQPFNIGSPRQVADVLYGRLGLPTGKKGKTGWSTDEAELERLAPLHPVAQLILEFRGYEKLQSTYIDALPRMVHPQTGRIHTSFNQTIAATGRLTSTDPNLQNIPIRTELGRAIRRAFIADSSAHILLKADYSQIELRILAHVSGDERLRAAYQEGQDIHRQTAAQVFGVEPAAVTPAQRSQAKVINFGIMYGMSPHGLSQQLGIGRVAAARFIERYFDTYPGVKRWIARLLEVARRTGYVETLAGRRRPVPDLTARNRMIREAAERVAVNAPIQGTCADMIKIAMLNLHRQLPGVAPGARMVCQVHDELVFSVPRERLEPAAALIKRLMEGAMRLDIPVVADISHGPNWAEMG